MIAYRTAFKSVIPLRRKVKFVQSCLILYDPKDYTVHGIFQARILEWVAFPFFRGSSQHRDQTQVSHITGAFLPAEPQGKPFKKEVPLKPLFDAKVHHVRGSQNLLCLFSLNLKFIFLQVDHIRLCVGKSVFLPSTLSNVNKCKWWKHVSYAARLRTTPRDAGQLNSCPCGVHFHTWWGPSSSV